MAEISILRYFLLVASFGLLLIKKLFRAVQEVVRKSTEMGVTSRLALLILCSSLIALFCNAADVLMMPSSIFPVHHYNMKFLAEELVKRNHSIIWLEYGISEPINDLPASVKQVYINVAPKSPELYDLYVHRNHSVYERQWEDESFWYESEHTSAWLAGIEMCEALLADEHASATFHSIANRHFDAVVLDDQFNPCGLILTALQKSLFVYWSMTGLRTESSWANHSPSPPSYVPVPGTGLTDEMSFWQRYFNMAAYLRQLYIHQHLILRRIDKIVAKYYYKENLPEAFYMERNASINFVNHPPIFDFARAYMPRVNFVGGLHCAKPKALPKALADFVNGANDEFGFILITSGFSNNWKNAPKKAIEELLKAMIRSEKIRYVWQYDGPKISQLPKNLRIAKWLPQQNLLGHPKCRAHISHGGLNSVIESVWHGVPIIGWPLSALHHDNLLRVTARHAGLMLESKIPSSDELFSAINRIYIRHYKDEMLVFQDMVIDVPYTELNHSAFWVEFIVRHQEVPHARSGADELYIHQYFLLDVIALAVVVIVGVLYAIYWLLSFVCRRMGALLCASLCRKTKSESGGGKKSASCYSASDAKSSKPKSSKDDATSNIRKRTTTKSAD